MWLIRFILIVIFFFPSIGFSFQNLIPNPSFEDKDRDSIPDGWNIYRVYYLVYKGKKGRAICLSGKGKISCTIRGIKKNSYYLLSFWIKRDGWKEGEYPQVEIFNKKILLNTVIGWGDWIKICMLLNSKENGRTKLSLIDPGLSHKIHFCRLCLVEFYPKLLFPEGAIYSYYPRFSWRMPENPYVLDFEIEISRYRDFRKVIKLVQIKGRNQFFPDFPIDSGRWFWRIKVYKNRKFISASKEKCFYIIPQFPVGIFGVPLKYVDKIKKAGFDSICLGGDPFSLEKKILLLSRKRINMLLSLPYKFSEKNIQLIFSLRKNPYILAWYLRDEPEIWHFPPIYLWKIKRYVKALDPTHPTLITLVRAKKVEEYGQCTDIIMVDPYPIPISPLTKLSESIDQVKRIFPEKPVWAVIQAFDWSSFPYGEEKRSWGRDPTYPEERCLTYLAVIHGASGLFYFTFKSKNYFILERKRHWDDIKRLISELNRIRYILRAPKIYPIESVCITEGIHYIVKRVLEGNKRGNYLLAVNSSPSPKEIEIRVPFLKNPISLSFDGYEAKIIKFK